jgi:hypothetical protein
LGTPSSYSNDARRQAAHILSQPPFVNRPPHVPDPLAGVLHAIGRGLEDVFKKPGEWLWRHVVSTAHDVFGRYTSLVLILVAIGLGVLLGTMLIRRRTRIGRRGTNTVLEAPTGDDVGMLEAAADAAEQRGDLEEAVRLRFRAGFARLESAGVIASRLVTTTEQARRTVHNPTFDSLAQQHETIAYAGRAASPADAGTSRENWPLVIDEIAPTKEHKR